ncbi:hypothetical protein D3C78_1580060 [compost metagenome]
MLGKLLDVTCACLFGVQLLLLCITLHQLFAGIQGLVDLLRLQLELAREGILHPRQRQTAVHFNPLSRTLFEQGQHVFCQGTADGIITDLKL